jgi:hypothetical protein
MKVYDISARKQKGTSPFVVRAGFVFRARPRTLSSDNRANQANHTD